MLGNPKYIEGDVVKFEFNDEIKEGTIYIVDKYGTLFPDVRRVGWDIALMVSTKKQSRLF